MLHYAVGAGNLPALKFLIEACGADLQIIDVGVIKRLQ